jgi:lysozyme
MAKNKIIFKQRKKVHRKRRKNYNFRRYFLLLILGIALLFTGWYLKNKITFYYTMYFEKSIHKNLKNSEEETARINRIVTEYNDKIFGFDISHYQEEKDIRWDSLSIANGSVKLDFVVMRATMGKKKKDKNFDNFWKAAKENNLIRGAYHFYKPDEDPIMQADNYLESVQLEEGDLVPVVDIEKIPRRKSQKKFIENLKTWLQIVEEKYGKKPIIYTYYYYYKDYLRDDFNDYPLWLANYNNVTIPSPEDDWKMWQFTEKGIVNGINTKVDLNVYNGNSWSFRNLTLH